MNTFATSAKPPNAISVWSDIRNVYCEIPAKEGPPLILKYPFSEAGLTKVLALMKKQALAFDPKGGFYSIPAPKITTPKPATFTETQRATARDILKKQGLI